jgi:cysteine desulfurase
VVSDDRGSPADVIYLDHNATTPVDPDVLEAMLPYLRDGFGNPSSRHAHGARARAAVERARGEVAALIGAAPDEMVFTSGGTEANNLAIAGVARAAPPGRRALVTSVVEHPATEAPVARLEREGWLVHRTSVDERGVVRVAEAVRHIDEETALVTVLHSQNETGVLEPVAALAAAARAAGALAHTDAAQSCGKVAVDVAALGVDLLSIAGHKLYAPKGVGALYVRRGTALEPLLCGAGQERGLRPGTENVASVVGLGRACAIARERLGAEAERQAGLRERLWELLRAAVPGLAENGAGADRLPGTLSVRFPRVTGSALLAAAPEIEAATGSACHAGGEEASAVLRAMGLAPVDALGTVRLSLGRTTGPDDVDRAAQALSRAWASLTGGG